MLFGAVRYTYNRPMYSDHNMAADALRINVIQLEQMFTLGTYIGVYLIICMYLIN